MMIMLPKLESAAPSIYFLFLFLENALSILGLLDTLYLDALLVLGLFEQFVTVYIYIYI